MINPLKLKCTEQASRIGLGDMAKKVNELVKAHNLHLEKHAIVANHELESLKTLNQQDKCHICKGEGFLKSPQMGDDWTTPCECKLRNDQQGECKRDCARCDYLGSNCAFHQEDPPEQEEKWDEQTEKQWKYKIKYGWETVAQLRDFINRNFVSKQKIRIEAKHLKIGNLINRSPESLKYDKAIDDLLEGLDL